MGGDVESVWTDVQKNKFIMSPLSLSVDQSSACADQEIAASCFT